jgi:hypothetical protein
MRWKPAVDDVITEGPEGSRTIKRPSGSTEAYFRSDGANSGPLFIVYHVQKTAGTSLRQLTRANLPPSDVEITPDLRKLRYRPDELLSWYSAWYRRLDADRRARLCCVMSHSAGYLLPALDRPAVTLVLVREPVDRVLSFYYYKRRRDEPHRSGGGDDFLSLDQIYALDEDDRARLRRPARLESWDQFFNWQSRCLLSVFHDVSDLAYSAGPPTDADVWRTRLRELLEQVFFVGVQDRFAAYVGLLARRFGWTAFLPSSKVNTRRPPHDAELTASLREEILAYNWLDTELYELSRQAQERYESEETDFR